jgi:2-methylisocitrate lyase-like PEP mutase family enzyme
MNNFENFNKLHQQVGPLLAANVWNAQSAKVMEKLNVQAIATSSSAVAATLGYGDGEVMSFEEYLFVVKRIKNSTRLPFSVDLETGYGRSIKEIVDNVKRLHEIGVVGINIEDSIIDNGSRTIADAETFAEKLREISVGLSAQKIDMFINVRCDAYLLGLPDARKEGIRRIKLYELHGIHGIFLPCITDIEDIKASVKATRLPLNVMCMPDLPDFEALKSAGVKRISMGGFLNHTIYNEMEKKMQQVLSSGSFAGLFK